MSDNDNGEYDVPEDGPGLHFFAKLGLAIEGLSAKLEREARNEQRRLANLPVNIPFSQLSNPGAAVTDIISFDGPQAGREWHVRMLTAFASPVGSNATTVSWYVGQRMPGDAAGQLPVTMKRWEFTTLPGQEDFSPNLIVIRNGEELIAGLTGIPASSRIALGVTVTDQPAWNARFSVSTD